MRLETVISEMGVGGAERVVVELVRDAAARGDDLGLLANPGPLDRELADLAVERSPLPTQRTAGALARATTASWRFARRFKPDIVHAHNVRVGGLSRVGSQLAHPLRRPPLVATYHGVPHEEVGGAARILRLADAVVCVSEGLREQLGAAGVPSRLLSVIPNGVPDAQPLDTTERERIDAELGLGDGAPVVSIVGRLVPQKEHERFLRAAKRLTEEGLKTHFLVVGDGALRSQLEQRADELGLDSQVRFTGVRDDARALISRSDLIVFSSAWEGLSIAALEALAAGVPVVSTDVAGMRELLSSGAGRVVPHDDEALATAIGELLRDPELRARTGAEGRRLHGERYSTARMTGAYREIYERLLAA
ncbi:MAG: glycosyltransferase [Solirubrobacterales bacterium]